MGKSKARIFHKGIHDQLTNISREEAITKTAKYLNDADIPNARSLITMFGLNAEEILEAGASYESVVAIKNILR